MEMPSIGSIINRHDKDWKVTHLLAPVSSSGTIPIVRVFLSDNFKGHSFRLEACSTMITSGRCKDMKFQVTITRTDTGATRGSSLTLERRTRMLLHGVKRLPKPSALA